MKKIIAVLTTLILIFACCVTASAAAPSYTAAYSTPTVDGKVNSSEYGAAVPFNKTNVSLFYYNMWDKDPTGANANTPDINWHFAWNEDALYIGIIASNIENITDGKFQIDLSPEKKIKDGKSGIFYTFKVTALGADGIVGVSRDNFQTAGNTGKTSMNINKGVEAVAIEQSSGVYHMEAKIPLAELQVSGSGANFSKLALKEGTWGMGCYFIGNGGGYTSTQGAGNNSDGLVQYYNDFKLLSKSGTTDADNASSKTPTASTSSKTETNTSSKANTANNNTATTSSKANNTTTVTDTSSGTTANTGSNATGTNTDVADTSSTDDNASTDATVSDASSDTAVDADTDNDATTGIESEVTTDTAADEKSDDSNTSLIVVIIVAAVIVLGAAAAAVVIILKSNKGANSAKDE